MGCAAFVGMRSKGHVVEPISGLGRGMEASILDPKTPGFGLFYGVCRYYVCTKQGVGGGLRRLTRRIMLGVWPPMAMWLRPMELGRF